MDFICPMVNCLGLTWQDRIGIGSRVGSRLKIPSAGLNFLASILSLQATSILEMMLMGRGDRGPAVGIGRSEWEMVEMSRLDWIQPSINNFFVVNSARALS